MPEEMNSLIDPAENYDAKQQVEAIATGEEKKQSVDVSADYEKSKEFSVSPVDQTDSDSQPFENRVFEELQQANSQPENRVAEPTGDPQEFMDIAKDVSPVKSAGENITDDLVQHALELGQPGQ